MSLTFIPVTPNSRSITPIDTDELLGGRLESFGIKVRPLPENDLMLGDGYGNFLWGIGFKGKVHSFSIAHGSPVNILEDVEKAFGIELVLEYKCKQELDRYLENAMRSAGN